MFILAARSRLNFISQVKNLVRTYVLGLKHGSGDKERTVYIVVASIEKSDIAFNLFYTQYLKILKQEFKDAFQHFHFLNIGTCGGSEGDRVGEIREIKAAVKYDRGQVINDKGHYKVRYHPDDAEFAFPVRYKLVTPGLINVLPAVSLTGNLLLDCDVHWFADQINVENVIVKALTDKHKALVEHLTERRRDSVYKKKIRMVGEMETYDFFTVSCASDCANYGAIRIISDVQARPFKNVSEDLINTINHRLKKLGIITEQDEGISITPQGIEEPDIEDAAHRLGRKTLDMEELVKPVIDLAVSDALLSPFLDGPNDIPENPSPHHILALNPLLLNKHCNKDEFLDIEQSKELFRSILVGARFEIKKPLRKLRDLLKENNNGKVTEHINTAVDGETNLSL